MATELYVLRKNIGIKPLGKKEIMSVRFFRDHNSIFTIQEKNRSGKVLRSIAYQNHELTEQLTKWQAKGFTLS